MAVMRIRVVRMGVGHGFVSMPMRMLSLNKVGMVVLMMNVVRV